uniref:Uncharacterized protein n=1 Tax=Glossina morsitans morsitans TaxID=37546 RepID=A0A1B0GBR2_GLOMM
MTAMLSHYALDLLIHLYIHIYPGYSYSQQLAYPPRLFIHYSLFIILYNFHVVVIVIVVIIKDYIKYVYSFQCAIGANT